MGDWEANDNKHLAKSSETDEIEEAWLNKQAQTQNELKHTH